MRPHAGGTPGSVYAAQLQRSQGKLARLQRRNLLLSYLRLFWVVLAAVLAWYVYGRHLLRWPVLLLPLAGFGVTARLHATALAAAAARRRAVAWYEAGLSRVEDRWAGLHPRTPPAAASESLYANDLDLFNPGGVFELLCTTRTGLGEDTLAAWLLQPASISEVLARQAAVGELRSDVALREEVASTQGPDPLRLQTGPLAAWGHATNTAIPSVFRWLAPSLAALSIAAAVWWALGHPVTWFVLALLVNGTITFALQTRFKPLLEETEHTARPLRALAQLFEILESQSFTAERLRSAQDGFARDGQKASAAVRQLARLAGAAEQRANLITRLLDFGLLYSVHLAMRVEAWRRAYGPHLETWFKTLGDLEALLALSAYSFEHPGDPFPKLTTEPVLEAKGLGHPLLAQAQCIRNDVTLDAKTRLLVVSGSNMSGKSTLMRATGVACVMTMAGAPVRAHALRLGPLQVAASIQVQDSLQGGRSRFFAEILRLRAICEVARTQPPILFLLDELLAGTNSQDRLAGAAGVVEMLLHAGAIGLLSTHDLALTQLGAEVRAVVRNMHFEDRIENGTLQFDYTLRDGIITRSNGLELMRLIGLDV